MVCLWSADVLHALRVRRDTFRSLCPDSTTAFDAWSNGRAIPQGRSSTLVLLDPSRAAGSGR
jgi:hypothetical protein